MGVGGKITYFWNLSKSVFRQKNENGFLSNLGGGGYEEEGEGEGEGGEISPV